jgi:hypothetical protein
MKPNYRFMVCVGFIHYWINYARRNYPQMKYPHAPQIRTELNYYLDSILTQSQPEYGVRI